MAYVHFTVDASNVQQSFAQFGTEDLSIVASHWHHARTQSTIEVQMLDGSWSAAALTTTFHNLHGKAFGSGSANDPYRVRITEGTPTSAIGRPAEAEAGSPPWLGRVRQAIARLMHKGECIGTICRIHRSGIFVTARHCILEGTTCLGGLKAFGEPLVFIAAFPRVDLAFFRGAKGSALSLVDGTRNAVVVGVPVQLASYPKAIDEEFASVTTKMSITGGQITGVATSVLVASADYTVCMPNSSGGGVLLAKSGQLAGLHIGILYHEAGRPDPPTAGAACSSASEPPDLLMEKNPRRMSEDPKLKDVGTKDAAQRSFSNIGHKAYAGLFIPTVTITQHMTCAGLLPEPLYKDLEAAASQNSRSRKRPIHGQSQSTREPLAQGQRHGAMITLKGVPPATGKHVRFE